MSDDPTVKLSLDYSDDGIAWTPMGEPVVVSSISDGGEREPRQYRHFKVDHVEGQVLFMVEVDPVMMSVDDD